jgi:preprotein translocase subunit SecD
MNRALVVVVAVVVGGILFWAAVFAYLHHKQTALLSQRPDHGTSFLIEAQVTETGGTAPDLAKLEEAIRKRCSGLGARIYWEPISETRVRIVTPKANSGNAEIIQGVISRAGALEFRLVHADSEKLLQDNEVPPGYEILELEQTTRAGTTRTERVVVKKKAEPGLSGQVIKQAMVVRGQLGDPEIHFTLQAQAAAAFAKVTQENIRRRLAIVIDGKLFSAPIIQAAIETGVGQITGQFTTEEAMNLAKTLESPLPIPVRLLEVKTF